MVIGDSLSDAGNIAKLSGSPTPLRFTTNPGTTTAENVAAALNLPVTASLSGGTDYAYGGACARPNGTGFTCVNSPGSFSVCRP